MKRQSLVRRRFINKFVQLSSTAAAATGLAALIWICFVVIARGIEVINWRFFTQLPMPPGLEGGGMANALVGTLAITFLAAVAAVPIGIAAGIHLAEFGRGTRLAAQVRFVCNLLIGIPSIITGIFVYVILVKPMRSFSGWAGVVALALIMLPVVVRTTEDMLAMVPDSLRESGLALGVPRWRTIIGVVFRSAKGGVLTGVLMALARVSGETAPLLFTALNSPFWVESLAKPTANLTVTIFNYAMSPYDNWQRLAWGASLVIMAGVLVVTITARWLAAVTKNK